jgi:hypothetical protein
MSSDAWPTPEAQPGPLPRIEDLPLASSGSGEQGYEQEAVRAAFESFYRHAAQLDASLRALEAVEVFRRDADALRNDLRALRELGGLGGGEPSWATQTYEPARREIPGSAVRLLFEATLIIAVAVIAGVAHLSNVRIVALMGGAFAIVAIAEWLAARARHVPPPVGFVGRDALEAAPYVEAPAPAPVWGAAEPDEDTEQEALTVVGAPAVDPWEQGDEPEEEADSSERGFLRRLRR